MKRRKGYLVVAITCFVVAIPLLLLMTGCGRVYLEPVEQVPIDQMFPAAPPIIPQAARADSSSSWSTANKLWITAAIGGQAADGITTLNALESSYCREANPLLGGSPGDIVIIGSKLALFGVGLWYTEYYLCDDPRQQKARNAIYATFAVIGAGLGAWNYNQECN